MAYLLGQIVKDKVRFYQIQHHEQPEKVSIDVTELDERVSVPRSFFSIYSLTATSQAKEHDVFDTQPFLRSRLFATNGYVLANGVIEKTFRRDL